MNETIYVSEETYDWLVKELAKPPKPNERLKALLNTIPPWETIKGNTENDQ